MDEPSGPCPDCGVVNPRIPDAGQWWMVCTQCGTVWLWPEEAEEDSAQDAQNSPGRAIASGHDKSVE